MSERALLEFFAENYLWADADWLVLSDDEFTYWQYRLAQRVAVERRPDGNVKWRVSTTVVEDVGDPDTAIELCCALNAFTAGWGYAYIPESREIAALIAMNAPPDWDRFLLRLSEAAKLSSWFSDVIAGLLAEAVSGQPAYTYPPGQQGLRQVPDATYRYVEALRGRPEWVMNLLQFSRFPDLGTVARVFVERMGPVAEVTEVDEGSLKITTLTRDGSTDSHRVVAGFAVHPIVGLGWQSRLEIPGVPRSEAALVAQHLTRKMFDDSHSNLMGAWACTDEGVDFQQWSTASELRHYERLPSFRFLGHGPDELWGLTSTLTDAVTAAAELPARFSPTGPGSASSRTIEMLIRVLGSFTEAADMALAEIPTPASDRADRRLLWLERRDLLLACAWFNPMGPTVSSLEICSGLDRQRSYLVEYLRHPFVPEYRVLAEVDHDSDRASILEGALQLVFRGSLPNAVALDGCPEDWRSELDEGMRRAVLALVRETDEDLAAAASRISQTMGRPWDWASPPISPPSQDPLWDSPPEQGYDLWLGQVSHPDNVAANFLELPDAWDGSLNFQSSLGNLSRDVGFDVGPLVVTYSDIGREQAAE